jgi:RHS repeat-associated protein
VAEFAYDALGRRIRKIDSIADETTLYYYNNNWQVLSETDADGTTQRWFVYRNYIDEPLMMYVYGLDEDFESKYYYVQDALYSVRALVSAKGWVIEEQAVYNVYGQPTSWLSGDVDADGGLDAADVMAFYQSNGKSECDSGYNWRCDVDNSGQVNSTDIDALLRNWNEPIASNQLSLFTNPYFFTGRRVDILDNGSLKIQYNRNRYYDYYTGRWLTHDPLGINPAGGMLNPFSVLAQYTNGMNLYQYAGSNPIMLTDPIGGCEEKPKETPPCKCFCVEDVYIESDWKLVGLPEQVVSQAGVQFKAAVRGVWKDSKSGYNPPLAQWWEWFTVKPDKYPATWATEDWHDVADIDTIFSFAEEAPTECGVEDIRTHYRKDDATTGVLGGIPTFLSVNQTLFFGIRVNSSPGCGCTKPHDTVYALSQYDVTGGVVGQNKFSINDSLSPLRLEAKMLDPPSEPPWKPWPWP